MNENFIFTFLNYLNKLLVKPEKKEKGSCEQFNGALKY